MDESAVPIVAEISLELPVLKEVTRVRELTLLEKTGEFWILNSGAPHLIKTDSRGRVISSFGTQGPGPNELGFPMAIMGAGESWVEVLDVVRRSVRRFDLSGHEVHASPIPELQQSRVMLEMETTSYGDLFRSYFDDDQFLFLNFPAGLESTRSYWTARLDQVDRNSLETTAIIDFSERQQDHLEELEGGLRLLPIPLWATCPDGNAAVYMPFADSIYLLGTAESSLAVGRAPRRLRNEEALDFARGMLEIEVSAGIIRTEDVEPILQDAYRRYRHQFGPKAPAYVALHCDHQHHFWLQRFSTRDHFVGFSNTWDVLSPAGDLLGSVRFPTRFRPKIFRDGGIWGVREDSLDVNQVVRVQYPSRL